MAIQQCLPRTGRYKSSFTTQHCVTVEEIDGKVFVRDDKNGNDPTQPTVIVRSDDWLRFIEAVMDDRPHITIGADGGVTVRAFDGTTLSFDKAEWQAFRDGIGNGEFTKSAAA